MKKEYTEPKAEKVDFNYKEMVVASQSFWKGNNNQGCFKGSDGYNHTCTPKENN